MTQQELLDLQSELSELRSRLDEVDDRLQREAESKMTADQKGRLLQFLDEMERLPLESPNDGFSGADHDRVLYGEAR